MKHYLVILLFLITSIGLKDGYKLESQITLFSNTKKNNRLNKDTKVVLVQFDLLENRYQEKS